MDEHADTYPVTVHLGVLTASRPIGARVEFTDLKNGELHYEGRIAGLRPSALSKVYYRLILDAGSFDLPLSHPITLLTGPEGRPEDGHTFRITVISRGASGIMGPGEEKPHDYADDGYWGPMELHAEVRAWDQPTALRRASEMELRDWRLPSGVSLWHAREGDL